MKDKELQIQVGKKIREIRKNKKISQLDLAYSIDMSMNTISYIELGKISSKIDTLNKIANFLEVDISIFFTFFTNTNYEHKNSKKIEQIVEKLEKLSDTKIDKIDKIIDIFDF